eukprot:2911798-Rhodomonas_salina.1
MYSSSLVPPYCVSTAPVCTVVRCVSTTALSCTVVRCVGTAVQPVSTAGGWAFVPVARILFQKRPRWYQHTLREYWSAGTTAR